MRLLNMLSKGLLVGIAACVLVACSGHHVSDYQQTSPKLSLKSFFNGKLTAAGIVEDYSGKVVRKFNVTMEASWQQNVCVLKEWFVYDDGETQTRIWTITDLGNGHYEGEASDIIGKATGKSAGSALQWKYDMLLPVGDSEYRVTFDDWMYLVNDNTIMNRSAINKFGINVANVTLVIQKL